MKYKQKKRKELTKKLSQLISRDCRESVMIPNIFETSQSSGLNTETAEESRADQLVLSMSDIG